MPIRLRSGIRRGIGCAITLLVVLIPLQALADEPLLAGQAASSTALPQVIEPVAEVVEEVVEPTAAVVEEVVEPTAAVVEEVVEPTEPVVQDVGETAGGVATDVEDATAPVVDQAPTVEETQEAAGNASGQVQENVNAAVNDVSQNGGSATGAVTGDRSDAAAASGAAQAGGGKEPSDAKERQHDDRQVADRTTVASTGSAWRRMHFARLGVVVPTPSFLYQPVTLAGGAADDAEVDPCEDDPGLACLGLLFGIGEFADAGGDVLGLFLAATGVAVRGLIVFAFALLFAGVVALSIAPRRATDARAG